MGVPESGEAAAFIACPDCNGMRSQHGMLGHCVDIDGDLWHLPGRCTNCHPVTRCCSPCPACAGEGRIPSRLREPEPQVER